MTTAYPIPLALAAALSICVLPVQAHAARPPVEAAASTDQTSLMTKSSVIEDLIYFRDVWASKERALTPEARLRFNSFINQEIASARPMSRAGLALVFARGQAFTGNAHSGSNYADGLFPPFANQCLDFW